MDWTEVTVSVDAKDVDRAGDIAQMVVPVSYTHLGEDTDINGCYLRIAMETRNWAHVEQIEKAISDAGYHIVHRQNIG